MKVFISSTYEDLKEYRKAAIRACLRLGLTPVNMEEFGPDTADGAEVSLSKVDEAQMYLGIFAHRYGYVPASSQMSISEMEYSRAFDLKLKPILIWEIHPDYRWLTRYVDEGENKRKLFEFLKRVREAHTTRRFTTVDKFREDLFLYIPQKLNEQLKDVAPKTPAITSFPALPAPYLPHKYSLLQAPRVIGREDELKVMNTWVSQSPDLAQPVMCIVGVGGQGKSALAWQWFNDTPVSPRALFSGKVWWSFYESESSFEDFLECSLAYTLRRPREPVRDQVGKACQDLLNTLDESPFLFALDGVERLLNAYMRSDAARIPDDHVDISQGGDSQRRRTLRKTSDPRVGEFLHHLVQLKCSRIIITTRLFPADFENLAGEQRAGCRLLDLHGLTDEDALALWRSFIKRPVESEAILKLFRTFNKHPLLIQTLAGEVANFRPNPGSFEDWQRYYPDFNPFSLPLAQRRTHVLEYSLKNLSQPASVALNTLSAFRMAAEYQTLRSLLVGKSIATEPLLDGALTELEDRNLVGWDRETNQYDLHPIVRGVTWTKIPDQIRKEVLTNIEEYFEEHSQGWFFGITSIDKLRNELERYHALIGLRRWQEAADLAQLLFNALHELGRNRESAELLECLLEPLGHTTEPAERELFDDHRKQLFLYLALAHRNLGHLDLAIKYYRYHNEYCDVPICLGHQAIVFEARGDLHESYLTFSQALSKARDSKDYDGEAKILAFMGADFLAFGWPVEHQNAIRRIAKLLRTGTVTANTRQVILQFQIMTAINSHRIVAAERLIRKWSLAAHSPPDICTAKIYQGNISQEKGALEYARNLYAEALELARSMSAVFPEADILLQMARLEFTKHNLAVVFDLLNDAFEAIDLAPRRKTKASALLLQAQAEKARGNQSAAIFKATHAYQEAWCDGPPFAYQELLNKCAVLLKDLGVDTPRLAAKQFLAGELVSNLALDPQETLPRRVRHRYSGDVEEDWLADFEATRLTSNLHHRLFQCMNDEDYLGAIEIADRILAASNSDEVALQALAQACWYSGDYRRAEQIYTALLEVNESENYYASRGQVRAEMGESENAILDLQRVLHLSAPPENAYVRSGLGLALSTLGRFDEAFCEFDASIRIAPSNAWVYFNRGAAYERLNDFGKARRDYETALSKESPHLPPFKRQIALKKLDDLC